MFCIKNPSGPGFKPLNVGMIARVSLPLLFFIFWIFWVIVPLCYGNGHQIFLLFLFYLYDYVLNMKSIIFSNSKIIWGLLGINLLVGPKLCTWLLKGRVRPPQVLEWLIFLFYWSVRGLVLPRQEHGWVGQMIWMRVLLGWWHTNDRQVK